MATIRKRKPSGALKRFAAAGKYETRILGDIQRHLLSQPPNEGRDMTRLHVSELVHTRYCPRQVYYRLTGVSETREAASFQLETIWEEGHHAHRKWQGWINALGRLRGQWQCTACGYEWHAVSPRGCPECQVQMALRYQEVPIYSEEYDLLGHADGDIDEGTDDDPLLEIKTIGVGTIRHEMPQLLRKYSHTVTLDNGEERSLIDLDRLWRDLKRPFPQHLKQGMLYCHLLGRSTMIYLYEFKPTQSVKEFTVKFRKDMIEDLLEEALDLRWAVEHKRCPSRPAWAKGTTSDGCKTCNYRDHCWETSALGEQDATQDGPAEKAPRRVPRRQEGTRTRRTRPAAEAEVQRARGADTDNGDGRQGSDEPVRPAHSLAGLLERATGADGDRRAVRRRPPRSSGG